MLAALSWICDTHSPNEVYSHQHCCWFL